MAHLIDTNISIREALLKSRYEGLESRNPKLLCHNTRNRRDKCIVQHGFCGQHIEDHFQCLEQFYKKEKVDRLRREFKSQSFSMVKPLKFDDLGQFDTHEGEGVLLPTTLRNPDRAAEVAKMADVSV